jgi:serine/threonine protein kinase
MEGGQLRVPENGFTSKEALKKMKQFLESYAELYKRGMYHRDIKPANILMDKDESTAQKGTIMKLSDFGAARGEGDKKQHGG